MAVGEFALPANNPSGGGGTYTTTLREYTTSGTWTKPTGLKMIEIICIAGGGGAGSGTRGSGRGGGGAGGGGCTYRILFDSDLSSTESYTIGAGGGGGAAITTDSTTGANGSAGSNTTFGTTTKAQATGGRSGNGSGNSSNEQASGTLYTDFSRWCGSGRFSSTSGGGGTAVTSENIILNTWNTILGGTSGGSNLGSFNTNGGVGNQYLTRAGVLSTAAAAGIATGTKNGANGNNNVSNRIYTQSMINLSATLNLGSSGGSGASLFAAASGSGGNGGLYGGAGSGGGGSRNGYNSGAGGNGANGCIIIVEHTLS
jgi:hypothetical protein